MVDAFRYLGSTVEYNDTCLDAELCARIGSACAAFGRLTERVWSRHGIKLRTKLKVYKAVVLPCLLYSAETYTLYRRHVKRLSNLHQKHLRRIMNIKWQDHITNTEVLRRADTLSIDTILLKMQLRWMGHVLRMDDERLPKAILFSQLSVGRRNVGRPRLRYLDCTKRHLKAAAMPLSSGRHWHRNGRDGGKLW